MKSTIFWLLLAAVLGYTAIHFLLPKKSPIPPKTQEASAPASTIPSTKKSTSQEASLYHTSKKVMGTLADITIATNEETLSQKAFEKCLTEMERLDALLTTWTPDSDVSRINEAAGKAPVAIQDDTLAILARSIAFSQQTDGLFDVTVGAFSGLWKFDQDRDGSIPTDAAVKERLALVGYRDLVVDSIKKTAFLQRSKMKITLGGIGKGFAVDHCVSFFREMGLQNFLVQLGGDLYVAGERAPGTPWRVGIRDPRGEEGETFATFTIKDRSFSTSGDYERFVIKDGVRYHHILDPRNGYPATESMSATVCAKDATTAEGLSKAFFLWGAAVTQQKIESGAFGDAAAVVVSREGVVYVTPSLKDGSVGKELSFKAPKVAP